MGQPTLRNYKNAITLSRLKEKTPTPPTEVEQPEGERGGARDKRNQPACLQRARASGNTNRREVFPARRIKSRQGAIPVSD